MTDHERTWRRRFGRDPLQPACPAHSVACEPADFVTDVGLHGRDGVVVPRLDPHDARGLRRTKSDGEHRTEGDRHLAEDVPGPAFADDALEPVDPFDRFDPTLDYAEERALAALVHRVLPRHEADVRRRPRKPFALGWGERCKDADPPDLFRRHHDRHIGRRKLGSARPRITCSRERERPAARSRPATTMITVLRRTVVSYYTGRR